MTRYTLVVFAIAGGLIAVFLLGSLAGFSLLEDPAAYLGKGGLGAATVGLGLLVSDVLLPVPSNVVMVMHGTLFGVVLGSALSLCGSVAATAFAFWLGRKGSPLLARVVSAPEQARAERLFARFGGYAIALSRPLPIVAETVALLAGTTSMRWPVLLAMATLGGLPPAVIYALAGASVVDVSSAITIFAGVLLLTLLAWLMTRLR